ncbi:unnamed protein product [Schistocephalus solidus]|uniref:Protein phosphatase 1 regulatory subunit 1C n=1 Tax=Schistocephalus solidus TaxID=70667 RepID=A0A183SM93_SCHSO|nr:unnamed protein product [Schistocephalus solidus]
MTASEISGVAISHRSSAPDLEPPLVEPAGFSCGKEGKKKGIIFKVKSELNAVRCHHTRLTSNTASPPEKFQRSSEISAVVLLVKSKRSLVLRFQEEVCSRLQTSPSQVNNFRKAKSEPIINSLSCPFPAEISKDDQEKISAAEMEITQENGEINHWITSKKLQLNDQGDNGVPKDTCENKSLNHKKQRRINKPGLFISKNLQKNVRKCSNMLAVGFAGE